ncbi:MAG: TonB-dependent receptor [Ferruginibacter sp.]|nr:TonB-dependent receptor [Ferruginibacter sp.]
MTKLKLIVALLYISLNTNAQTISGKVKDDSGKGLPSTTISLVNEKDSSIAKYATTLKDGTYLFENIRQGKYFLQFSHVGTISKKSEIVDFATSNIIVPEIILIKSNTNLTNVVVETKKQIVEVKADKTILNVEGTINATGNDALELLRKAPGVVVDKDDNLSLAGKNGLQVYIDGKQNPLTGAELAAYLKTLQASQIESIEIITNPSAKYDAAGNAGIINIKFKKNKNLGTNGSVNTGFGIGIYAKYNAGININNRNKNTNIFASYNYSRGLNFNTFKLERTQADTFFSQTNAMKNYNNGSHNFKAGADYFVNKKSTIGIAINGNIADVNTKTAGPMYITFWPTNTLSKYLNATSNNINNRNNVNFNVNYRYITPTGKELNIDADYGYFNLKSNQFQPNDYYSGATNTFLFSNTYHMVSPTKIDIYAFKIDYEQNVGKGKLGVGGKIGFVNTNNDFNRYNVIASVDYKDKDRSNTFLYNENINALYVNYNQSFKGFTLQAGLRAENTISKGQSLGEKLIPLTTTYAPYDSVINKNYFNVFPSAAITFNKNPMSQLGFTFSSRIDRPAYQDLNPFEFKINDYTFMKGNTQLKPQYTNSFGITHTYKYKLTSQLNYSHVKDMFTQVPDTTEKSKSFLSKKNLATQDIVSLNISYPFSKKWYSLFTNINSFYSHFNANFGGGNRTINLEVVTVSIFAQNSFKLGKGFTAEVSGMYNSPTIWQGVFKTKAMYGVDAGIQKTLLKGKATLKTSVSDIFHTMKWRGTTTFSGQTSTASGRWESSQFKINFAYRFGNSQVKAARQRKEAAEEERKRTQASGGMGN